MEKKENVKAYVWTAVASGFVGLLVGTAALLIQLYEPAMLRILLSSILAGIIIGIICRGICLWLIGQNYRSTFLWSLILVIVGVGTAVAATCIGELSLRKVIILVVVAEVLGLVIAYTNHRQAIYVNEKLHQKREQFRNGSQCK